MQSLSDESLWRRELRRAASALHDALRQRKMRLVLAESCTGGLAAAAMAERPGVSDWFCGSAVVYRLGTKTAWLATPTGLFEDPGVVSAEVARSMAWGALRFTPEANVAVSITGHLGPNAPDGLDGIAYVGAATRFCKALNTVDARRIAVDHVEVTAPISSNEPATSDVASERVMRQLRAATAVLRRAHELIEAGE